MSSIESDDSGDPVPGVNAKVSGDERRRGIIAAAEKRLSGLPAGSGDPKDPAASTATKRKKHHRMQGFFRQ
jgi:hypothetical protein